MRKRKIANFTAGPAILPAQVKRQLDTARWNFLRSGIPITETSHRKDIVLRMTKDTIKRVRELFGVPDSYAVALVPGGGSEQFKSWILNLVPYPVMRKPRIAYIESDIWATAALEKEGALDLERADLCDIVRIKPDGCEHRPIIDQQWYRKVYTSCDMVYIVSNGTGGGVQYPSLDIPVDFTPLVIGDFSSDFGSRPIDVTKFAYIFGGTQKCLGIQGITLVIARKDLLVKNPLLAGTQSVLTQTLEKNAGALFNTADVEAIYALNRMLAWIKHKGGLEAMEVRAKARAKLLYDAIDESRMFAGLAEYESRSLMNVTFRIVGGETLYRAFLLFCKKHGIEGIDGHEGAKKLWGPHFRASLYTGQTMTNVKRLIAVMKKFEREVMRKRAPKR